MEDKTAGNKESGVESKIVSQRDPAATRPTLLQYAVLALVILVTVISGFSLDRGVEQPQQSDRVVTITFLHLNDVYQILPSDLDGSGGLARIATLRKQILASTDHLVFVLAGDTISPSLESTVFSGAQMIDLWNQLGLTVATLGNHEFDFKPDVLRQRMKESAFPWLGANVIDTDTGAPFAGAQRYIVREFDGVKLGIFGVLTTETARTSQPGPKIKFLDPFATARDLVAEMKNQGVHVIVALTHLQMSDDEQLARTVKVNLILGGHEHELLQSQPGGIPIYKMGSDARNLGRIDVKVVARTGEVQSINLQVIPVNKGVPEDPRVRAVIDDYEKQLEARLGVKLDDRIGEAEVDLDAVQAAVRAREANIGNFIADCLRDLMSADVALVNGGGIRSDRLYPKGPITNRHVLSILPFKNKVVAIQVTGSDLRQALERGVSRVVEEGEDGGFPQVAGLQFVYNKANQPGSRVLSVTVGGKPLDNNATYKLATSSYLAGGNEGYDMFRGKPDVTPAGINKTDVEAVLERIKGAAKIAPKVEGRITVQ
jgi:5'-nucleotidase